MADDPFQNLFSPRSAENAQSGTKPGASTPAPLPEKAIIEKLTEANAAVRRAIDRGKLDQDSQVSWTRRVCYALRPLYGEKALLLVTLNLWRKEMTKSPLSPTAFIARLEQVERLLASFNAAAVSGSLVAISQSSLIPTSKNVFIIHGHDELNLRRLSQFIQDDFKLTPEVLLEKPGQSATTIDKFEQHAKRCSYAIALFTPDDTVTTKKKKEYLQARPNVIFETGWFVGRLGKGRVLILLQDGVRIYSDFEGVNRIQFSSDVLEKSRDIQAELKAAQLI